MQKDINGTKATISSGNVQLNTQVPTSRKRARPRKVDSEINTPSPSPRKRGRPRKADLKVDEQNLKTNRDKPTTSN